MKILLQIASTILWGVLVIGLARAAEQPLELGTRRELFVDDYLIDSLSGDAVLKLHSPVPAPTSTPQPPANPWASVFHDGNRYQMLVRGLKDPTVSIEQHGAERHYLNHVLLYFQSGDGVNWHAPKLNLYDLPSFPDGNVVLADQFGVEQNFAAFRDPRPDVLTEERYKGLGGKRYPSRLQADLTKKYGPHGLRAFVSGDGIHWKPFRSEPVVSGDWGQLDSQNVVFWSEQEQLYVCYFRVFTNKFSHGLRSVNRTTSRDFVIWSEPVEVAINLPGEELYTSNVQPYFRAPHLYLALPTRYFADRGSSTDVVLATSRDGVRFQREFGEAFIRPGLDPKAWGNRANYAAYPLVPTSPTELSIYMSGGRRFTLRTDGFASLHASSRGGECITKSFTFQGEQLEVNFATSAGGQLRFELQDATGRVFPGFRLEDCDPICGDQIEYPVRWRNDPPLQKLVNSDVRLRIVLKDADLYSLRFHDTHPKQ